MDEDSPVDINYKDLSRLIETYRGKIRDLVDDIEDILDLTLTIPEMKERIEAALGNYK